MSENTNLTGGGYRPIPDEPASEYLTKGGHKPQAAAEASGVEEGGHKPQSSTNSGNNPPASPPSRGPRGASGIQPKQDPNKK